jgi:hypothetical protein
MIHDRRLPSPSTTVLLVALLMSGCTGDSSVPAAALGQEADSARAILERVTPALSAQAFERLHDVPFTADVRTSGSGPTETRRVRNEPTADGTLRLTTEAGTVLDGLEDPVSSLLPGIPPYLAPRTRDRYRMRLLRAFAPNGRRLIGAEAVLVDEAGKEPVRRVTAWADEVSSEPYALEVVRRSASAIFAEAGRAAVRFRPGSDGPLPAAAGLRARVDVPFGSPRLVALDILIQDPTP